MPEVSILMAVYNGERFLREAIESCLSQTYTDFEFIIINDGSQDASLSIIRESAAQDPRVIFFDRENVGLTKSLNFGLHKSTGRFIARIDADDVWLPMKLEKQIDFIKKNKYCLVGTAYKEIDESGTVVCSQRIKLVTGNAQLKQTLLRYNPFCHASVLFDRQIVQELGGYDEDVVYAQDYHLWVKILSKYMAENISEVLTYRRHSKGMISQEREREQRKFALQAKLKAFDFVEHSLLDYRFLMSDIAVSYMPPFLIKFLRKVT